MDNDELKRTQVEYRIHVAIVEHKNFTFPQIEITHAGKARDETHAHFLSEMGYMAGTGDILWFCLGKFGEMEVKSPTGEQQPDQKTREAKLRRNGGLYTIVRSVREAMDYWESLGFRRYSYAITEPDLRSDAEKKKAAFELYRR